jgi:hypothetical protein
LHWSVNKFEELDESWNKRKKREEWLENEIKEKEDWYKGNE